MWTIFSIDISLRDYDRALRLNEVQSLLDDVGRLRLVRTRLVRTRLVRTQSTGSSPIRGRHRCSCR